MEREGSNVSAGQLVDKPVKSNGRDGRPKRRRIGSVARRAQLVEVAEAVFIKEGYERASMEQIADQAGVTRTLVYQHFPTKRDLYMAVLDRVIPEFVRRVLPPVEVRPKHPWRILAGLRAFLTLVKEEQGAIKLLLAERPREPWIADRLDRLFQFFSDYFVKEYEGAASESQIRLIGSCYIGLMESIARDWSRGVFKEMELDEMAFAASQFVWAGLRSLELPTHMVDEEYAGKPPKAWRASLEYLEALADQFPGTLPPEEVPKGL